MSRPSRHNKYDTMSFFENDGSMDYPAGDYKDSKMDGPDGNDDMDDLNCFGRKESRIPVAIRRLRSRADRINTNLGEEGSRLARHASPRGDHSSQAEFWNPPGERDRAHRHHDDRRVDRNNSAVVPAEANHPAAIKGSEHQERKHVCPHCNRTFAVVSREGVYVAFSIGLFPLVLLIAVMLLLLLIPCIAPTVVRHFKQPPGAVAPPHAPPKGGIFYRWWKK